MHLYRCDLELHDYLFFATSERGRLAETGPFVHNYALAYALGWARSLWRSEVQEPHYAEELAAAWEAHDAYVTPAALLCGSYVISQYNTMPETYELGKTQSRGYPDWGFVKCFRPGARFRFYVISRDEKGFPQLVRLGKFTAKAELRVEAGERLERRTGRCTADALLAWDDLAVRPTVFDLISTALPTRLVYRAEFSGVPYVRAHFADGSTTTLPLSVGYLARADKKAFKCGTCREALSTLETALCDCW